MKTTKQKKPSRVKWVDANKDRIINVKAEDTIEAKCSDHQECVIAKAIKRQLGATWVDVGPKTVLIQPNAGTKVFRYKLTTMGREQIKFFDREGQFAPCFVELKGPSTSQQLEIKREYQRQWKEDHKKRYQSRKAKGDPWVRGPRRKRVSLATR